mmetsp:Transcript_45566/g.74446  ORF Transcript_45566/g.74446 Transcript_45566/m.74446 type:complete len:81 (+) Transcript_45566:889-1131(+)
MPPTDTNFPIEKEQAQKIQWVASVGLGDSGHQPPPTWWNAGWQSGIRQEKAMWLLVGRPDGSKGSESITMPGIACAKLPP